MRAKIVGAALAACVGACALAGGVGRAKAEIIAISAGFESIGEAPISLISYYDTDTGISYGRATVGWPALFGYDYQTGTRVDRAPLVISHQVFQNNTDYTLSTSLFTIYYGGDPDDPFAYSEYGYDAGGYVVVNGETVGLDGNISFAIVDKVGSVPLPSAAPMFGAALITLGGFGYASRRKVDPA